MANLSTKVLTFFYECTQLGYECTLKSQGVNNYTIQVKEATVELENNSVSIVLLTS